MIQDWISKEDYFRIVKAVSETMYKDLIFLSEHIMDADTQIGNSQVLALYRAGLMVSAGIDGNADVESQPYAFSSLESMVDNLRYHMEIWIGFSGMLKMIEKLGLIHEWKKQVMKK